MVVMVFPSFARMLGEAEHRHVKLMQELEPGIDMPRNLHTPAQAAPPLQARPSWSAALWPPSASAPYSNRAGQIKAVIGPV